MSFESTPRIMAFPASEIASLATYRELYGDDLPVSAKSNAPQVKTLLGHSDGQSGIIRAGAMPTTVSATQLTDGRYAVSGLWSLKLKEAWDAGDVVATELTLNEFMGLLPQPDDF